MILSAKWMLCGFKPLFQGEPLDEADTIWHQPTNLRHTTSCFLVHFRVKNLSYCIAMCCLLNEKAMMRKVMHHSEEIYLFVLINKLTTHLISEPPLSHRILYFLGLPDLKLLLLPLFWKRKKRANILSPLWRDLSLCADQQTYNPFNIW
jgi:hypothetical protein